MKGSATGFRPPVSPNSLLAQEEWDFESLPNDQVEYCLEYERARYLPNVIRAVEVWRNWEKSSALLADNQSANIVGGALRISLGILPFFPEFPRTPWLKIQPAERRSRIEKWGKFAPEILKPFRLDNADRGFQVLDPSENRSRLEALFVSAQMIQDRDVLRGYVEDLLCQIDWTKPKEKIIQDFAAWVRKSAPAKAKTLKKRSGKAAMANLKRLGAWRLFHYFRSFEKTNDAAIRKATEHTQRHPRLKDQRLAPLYQTREAWLRAIKQAENCLKKASVPVQPI